MVALWHSAQMAIYTGQQATAETAAILLIMPSN
jgi:hypothetical protein